MRCLVQSSNTSNTAIRDLFPKPTMNFLISFEEYMFRQQELQHQLLPHYYLWILIRQKNLAILQLVLYQYHSHNHSLLQYFRAF